MIMKPNPGQTGVLIVKLIRETLLLKRVEILSHDFPSFQCNIAIQEHLYIIYIYTRTKTILL